MIRAFIFAVKLGLLVFVAVWVANRPGTVELSWLGYDIRAQVGFVILVSVIGLLLILLVYKFYIMLTSLALLWKRYRQKKREIKGYKSLTLGLSAVAAGDSKLATYHAYKMRKFLPQDQGLSLLLEAQALKLGGQIDAAEKKYQELVKNEDTAFLGLRGLIQSSVERGDYKAALNTAYVAQKKHPKQAWIQKAVYELEVVNERWQSALKTLSAARRYKSLEPVFISEATAALYLKLSEEAVAQSNEGRALTYIKKAVKADPEFLPARIYLIRYYADNGKVRSGRKAFEKTWPNMQHPELVSLWFLLAGKRDTRMRMAEKLVALKPDCAEGQMAAAKVAIESGLWGEARQYLNMAKTYTDSARLYELWAQFEDRLGNESAAKSYYEKAAHAPAEKVWTCKKTGRIYERWSPAAAPHNSFNTIIWDYPRPGLNDNDSVSMSEGLFLLG
jgi:HemY protein